MTKDPKKGEDASKKTYLGAFLAPISSPVGVSSRVMVLCIGAFLAGVLFGPDLASAFRGLPRPLLAGVGVPATSVGIRNSSAEVLGERRGWRGIWVAFSLTGGVDGCRTEVARVRCCRMRMVLSYLTEPRSERNWRFGKVGI